MAMATAPAATYSAESPPKPEDVIARIKQGKAKRIRVFPQHVPRASEIGHPCERYLVLSITRWADRMPHAAEVEFIFEGGRMVEELAIKDFEDAGFRVYRPEPDKAIMESKPRITGHIDIRVDFGDGIVYTGEIKGLNIFDFERINSVEDMLHSKKPWILKYPAQLMTYLYIKGEERGFFYLKSIPRFQPKLIWVDLDLSYMESILQKTERIERHVTEGTLPSCCDDAELCQKCAFLHVCLPEIRGQELVFLDDEDLLEKLERREELAEARAEYEALDREIKKALEGKEKLSIGDFLITGKWIERKGYVVQDSRYWQSKITKLVPEQQSMPV